VRNQHKNMHADARPQVITDQNTCACGSSPRACYIIIIIIIIIMNTRTSSRDPFMRSGGDQENHKYAVSCVGRAVGARAAACPIVALMYPLRALCPLENQKPDCG
jgi:hypothetical protein